MNNSISLRRCQNYVYPDPPVNVTPEHTTDINSQCWAGSEGGHHHVFCEVRNLMHIFWGIRRTVQWHLACNI